MNKKLVKSLVFNPAILYVVVGAAIALGTYFMLSSFAANRVQANFVPVHKSTYKAGESIKFGLTNNSKENVRLANGAPWDIKDAAGNTVYSPVSTQEISRLEPADTIYWSWHQRNNKNNRVAAGTYKLSIKYRMAGRDFTAVLPFRIAR